MLTTRLCLRSLAFCHFSLHRMHTPALPVFCTRPSCRLSLNFLLLRLLLFVTSCPLVLLFMSLSLIALLVLLGHKRRPRSVVDIIAQLGWP